MIEQKNDNCVVTYKDIDIGSCNYLILSLIKPCKVFHLDKKRFYITKF